MRRFLIGLVVLLILIASVGVGVMKEPVNTVTVAIDGIGELTKEFRQ